MTRLNAACTLLLVCFTSWAQQAPATADAPRPDDRAEQLESLFAGLAEEGFQGGAILAEAAETLWQGSYGFADIEAQEAMTDNAVYELASVGKAFTAMAILTLVDAERMTLDDAVAAHLDDFPYNNITVRHLLTHTAGLPDYTEHLSPDEVPQGFDGFIHNEDILAWLAGGTDELEFEPGSRFSYSNSGYLMLALVVEAVSGQEFAEYLQDAIFEPLGMQNTRSFTTRYTESAYPSGYAFGYTRTKLGRLVLPESRPNHEFLSAYSTVEGDGTVAGSLPDFALWEAAWSTDVLIPQALRDEAFTPATLTDGVVSTYAFAWENDPDSTVIHHWGGWPGYTTACYIDPTTRTVFAFASTAPVYDWDWVEEAVSIVFDED